MAKKNVLYEVIADFLDEEFEDLMDDLNCVIESFVDSQTLADTINSRLDTVVELTKKQLIRNLERRIKTLVVYEVGSMDSREIKNTAEEIIRSLISNGVISDKYTTFMDVPTSTVKETAKVILENL